jgi:murein DD-endopeptidase MepM/ murein hydrolase activator NlpD
MSVGRTGHPRQTAQHAGQVAVRPAGSVQSPAAVAGYIFAHAGRQIRLGPVAFWIFVGTVVIMAGWTIATATYFAFRDDLLKGLIARQAEQQNAYEDRIIELRARIDRTTSRQLLDQEQFEQKLDDLMRRQSTLESRATALGGIADPVVTGAIKSPGSAAPAGSPMSPQARDRRSSLEPDRTPGARRAGKDADINAKLSRVEASLDRLDHRQALGLAQLQERYEGKARRLRGVLADLGLKLGGPAPAGSGGPFVPIKLPGEGNSFERAVARVKIARTQAEHLTRTLLRVPLRKPVNGEIDLSSTFGVRVDPFLHVAAMHTGLDFRGDTGDPIHATAAGTVVGAGWSGGYGRMIEIDHGNGLSTRYGHLSQIDVKVGDEIRIGQIIGRMGSTGRSTGPHLHYETRIDGDAVDPQKFLHAGARLAGASSDW